MTQMSSYEEKVWESLSQHWDAQANRRRLPGWASGAIDTVGEKTGAIAKRVSDATPEPVKRRAQEAGDLVADAALKPALKGAVSLLELADAWCLELNDPRSVEAAARRRGLEIDSFEDLRGQDLKTCDRLLSRSTLTWTTIGALEGGAMGALAMVPVAGIPVAITADVIVVQALSVSIAARIAYSYGFDAKDPDEQEFIRQLVQRSFLTQAVKAKPLNDAAQAAAAAAGRQRWSPKLKADHQILAALEKLMRHMGPAGAKVNVQAVAKALPVVGIAIGAGVNSQVLRGLAADSQRHCQTRFLSEKYGLELSHPIGDATP